VDAPESDYAPVSLAELRGKDVSLWVLGHVHKPQLWQAAADVSGASGGCAVLYPGSPQALDPSEAGPHGPWLIELDNPRAPRCRQLPIAKVRYDPCAVDLTAATEAEELEARVQAVVIDALDALVGDDLHPELLSLRVRFTGATALCGRVDELARNVTDLERSRHGVRARIEKWINDTRPAVDVAVLAERHDPPGSLARMLLALEQTPDDPSLARLLADATARLTAVYAAKAYLPLADREQPPDREAARQVLLVQGRKLLEKLLAQTAQPAESAA
jgi:DNA repair exonuclease SbcCD nuclease subunit